jgi:GGDEF domain-containing protein
MSGIYDFDENLGQSFEASAAEVGIEDGQQDPGTWDGFASGVGQGVMRETFARTGQTVAMAGAVLPIIGDAVNSAITGRNETRAQDWYFKNVVDDTVNNAMDYWAPGPQEVGKAGRLAGELVGGLGQLVIGAGNPSLMVANAQMGTAVDMVRSGVDAETAQQVGAVAGVATAVGAWLPIFGKSASSKIATGTIGNIAQGIVQRGATGEILDDAGYGAQAKNFDAFDLQSMAVDGLMGVAFGALQAKSKYPQPDVLDSAVGKKAGDAIRSGSRSLENSINSMIGNAVLTKTHKDAIAALATFKSYAVDSAPGRPLSDADFNAHQTNMDMGLDHLLHDKPFDDSMVREAAFEQKPPRADAEEGESIANTAFRDWYNQNRTSLSDELFIGGQHDVRSYASLPESLQTRAAHGMSKSLGSALTDLRGLLKNGIDPNRGGGKLYTAPLGRPAQNAGGGTTAGGNAYSDGAFTLIAKKGVNDGIADIGQVEAIVVNSSLPDGVVAGLRTEFPNIKIGRASEVDKMLSQNTPKTPLAAPRATPEEIAAIQAPDAPVTAKPEMAAEDFGALARQASEGSRKAQEKPPRADAEDIRSELPSYKETVDPVNPAEYAAARYAEMAKESGLSDEQAANMAKYHEPDISPVTGRYSDHELLGAVARAAKGEAPYKYVEMDTTKLGKINARKGANDAADDFIKDTGDALQAIYGDAPVYHRGAGRFAALVPEGFDVEAAQAQAREALTGITKKHGVDDLGVDMYHGENPVPKGEALDKAIKPAQDKLNASKPEDTSDVAGIEGIKAWSDTSTGSAREVSRRIEEATGSLQQGSGDLESTARYIARSLERQSTATEVKQAGEFLSPDEYRAKSVAEDAQKNSLSPEQTALHDKKILRDELTGAYRAVDRNPTVKRVQDYIQETGKPAVFAVADVSNLGGKNLALGQHTADIIFKQYHEIIMDNLQALGADVVPFRHGGDETSYIVVGAEESVVREAMAKAAADVQRFANRVGIADLPHKKTYTSEVVSGAKPRDTSKDGSGIYVGVNEIHPGKTPREIYAAGDREVDFNKYAGKVDVAGETMPLKSDSAKDPMSGYAARPEVKQALTADESITILDDNGNPVSGREAILQAAAEADSAVSLKEGFKAAALCAMRFTT